MPRGEGIEGSVGGIKGGQVERVHGGPLLMMLLMMLLLLLLHIPLQLLQLEHLSLRPVLPCTLRMHVSQRRMQRLLVPLLSAVPGGHVTVCTVIDTKACVYCYRYNGDACTVIDTMKKKLMVL